MFKRVTSCIKNEKADNFNVIITDVRLFKHSLLQLERYASAVCNIQVFLLYFTAFSETQYSVMRKAACGPKFLNNIQ